MKPFFALNNKKSLNNILTTRQMSQVKGGTTNQPPLPLPNDPSDGTYNATEGLDDDKRRTRPGGGGVTS